MAHRHSPTLEDVARAARTSTATISRALNAPDKVARETRDRIEQAIAALGYTPNFGGRSLASNATGIIGAVIPTMANAMFSSGLQAFQEVLAEAGKTLLVASSGYDPARELQQIRTMLGHGAGGLLLIGAERLDETRRFLALRNVPHVLGWTYQPPPAPLCAGFDNHRAAAAMTRRVLDLGHRRIAMIAGIAAGNDRAARRIDGVKAAVAAVPGAKLTDILERPYELEAGGAALDSLMSRTTPPTAVVCGNDVLAAGAMVAARAAKLRVPEDLSITGFDDIALAAVTSPGLTTVRVPQDEMGRAAARLLLAQVAGEVDLASVELATEIVMRGSLGPPR